MAATGDLLGLEEPPIRRPNGRPNIMQKYYADEPAADAANGGDPLGLDQARSSVRSSPLASAAPPIAIPGARSPAMDLHMKTGLTQSAVFFFFKMGEDDGADRDSALDSLFNIESPTRPDDTAGEGQHTFRNHAVCPLSPTINSS